MSGKVLMLAWRQRVLAKGPKFFYFFYFYGHISTLKTNRWHMASFYLLQQSQHLCQREAKTKLPFCFFFNNSYSSQIVRYRPQDRREGKWHRGGDADYTEGREKALHWEWKPTRPYCCLMHNHWSWIWVSIIQQEHCNPLWEGSRYWTLHYLFDRGIAGLQYIPPERLLWDRAPAAPLMTPSIYRGLLQHKYCNFTIYAHPCVRLLPWSTLLNRWHQRGYQGGLGLFNTTLVPASGSPRSSAVVCHYIIEARIASVTVNELHVSAAAIEHKFNLVYWVGQMWHASGQRSTVCD